MRLLEATVVVVEMVVVPLLVVAHTDNIKLWRMIVHLMHLKFNVEFVWWGEGRYTMSMSNPATVEVRLGFR